MHRINLQTLVAVRICVRCKELVILVLEMMWLLCACAGVVLFVLLGVLLLRRAEVAGVT